MHRRGSIRPVPGSSPSSSSESEVREEEGEDEGLGTSSDSVGFSPICGGMSMGFSAIVATFASSSCGDESVG